MTISNALHWQPSLTGEGVVTGIDDLDQSIRLILGTPVGSDPHRPLFGLDALDLVDSDFSQSASIYVQRATDAILKWEPRINKVDITPTQNLEHGTLRVRFWPLDNVMREMVVVL